MPSIIYITFCAIDTPIFATLQWLYLATVLGERRVVRHTGEETSPAPGMVNVVPVGLVRHIAIDADLFISTWALNESAAPAQDHVIDRVWFGASGLLLAMHHGDPLEKIVIGHGGHSVPVGSFMPPQRYLIR